MGLAAAPERRRRGGRAGTREDAASVHHLPNKSRIRILARQAKPLEDSAIVDQTARGERGGGAVQTAGREGRRVKVHLLRTGRFDFLRYEPPPTPAICDWTRTPHWPGLNEGFRCAARLCAARSDGNASGSRRGLRGCLSPSASLSFCFSLPVSLRLAACMGGGEVCMRTVSDMPYLSSRGSRRRPG